MNRATKTQGQMGQTFSSRLGEQVSQEVPFKTQDFFKVNKFTYQNFHKTVAPRTTQSRATTREQKRAHTNVRRRNRNFNQT